MAPEIDNAMAGGSLGDIASSFGLDLSNMQSTDAITPLLYPDLMEDNGFVSQLFKIRIETKDRYTKTDYYTYLKKYQKYAWWEKIGAWVKKIFAKKPAGKGVGFNPYQPSKLDDDIMTKIKKNIKFAVDKKTGVITISTTDQDAVVCKTIADSIRSQLQQFITKYRTNKARNDYEHYKSLVAQAKSEYERVRQTYGSYSDANMDVILESYKSKQEDLENDMQLKFNAYSTMVTQMNAARAKVQERTPVFTIIKGAAVPIRPSSPKRMIFVLMWFILAFIGTTIYILRDIILPEK